MKKFLVVLILVVSTFLSMAQMKSSKIFIGKTPTIIYTPSNYDASKKWPVIMFLHGSGEMGDGTDAGLNILLNSGNQANLLTAGNQYGFIVVAPQLVQAFNAWIPGWTDTYMSPVVNYIFANLPVDTTKFYVSGLSLGGGGAWVAVTSSFAPKIAAAIPICGTPQYDQDFSIVGKNHIPILAFHAMDDGTINYVATVNQVAAVNKYNPTPQAQMKLYATGGHGIWGTVYGDQSVYTWLLGQQKPTSIVIITPPVVVPTTKTITKTTSELINGKLVLTIFYSDSTSEVKQ